MKALWGLALGNFAVGTGALVVAGILPDIARDTGVTDAGAGQLITVYAVTYAVCAPLVGALTGNIDRRLLLAASAFLIAAANALAAVSTEFSWLLAARVAAAVGAALFSPGAAAVATMMVPPERVASAISIVFGGFVISSLLGVPLGTWIGGAFGWPVTFWFVAALAALAGITTLFAIPGGLRAEGASFRALGRVLADRRLMVALSMGATNMASQFIPYTFIALLLIQWAGATTEGITAVFLTFGLASLVGNVISGRASDRFGPEPTLLAGMIALPLVLAGLGLMQFGLVAAAVLLAVWGMCGFSFAAAQQARLVRLAPDLRGVVLSLHASSMYVGQALGAAVGALVLQDVGMSALGWAGAAMALLTLTLFMVSRWQWRGHRPL
ncbi:MAG: MFS transporter [Minwuia sp.]|uniref:MFS transporter n=1 Tax=Minwuia sp. TaxID=2493630 RepID=UPI003A83E94E